MWLPVVAVCVWSLGSYVTPAGCSHFMGGIIHWRPLDPAAFDGRVRSVISLPILASWLKYRASKVKCYIAPCIKHCFNLTIDYIISLLIYDLTIINFVSIV